MNFFSQKINQTVTEVTTAALTKDAKVSIQQTGSAIASGALNRVIRRTKAKIRALSAAATSSTP